MLRLCGGVRRRGGGGDDNGGAPSERLSDYELERQARIATNKRTLVALGLETEAEQMRSAKKSTKPASASAASHNDEALPVSVDTDASASAASDDDEVLLVSVGTDDEGLPVSVDTDPRRVCARLHEPGRKRPDYRDPEAPWTKRKRREYLAEHFATPPPADDGDSDESDDGDEAAAPTWAARRMSMRGFRRITMPAVAPVVGTVEANPLAAEIWALRPWKDVPAEELETSAKFLQTLLAHKGITKPGHVSLVVYLDEVGDGKRVSVDAADLEKLKKILEPLECGGTMAAHACSGVGYPRRHWTPERCSRLLSELKSILEGAKSTAEKKREAAVAVLAATEWAFFRPHADGHWRIRERVTVAAAVRTAAPLAQTVCADAEHSGDELFKAEAEELADILGQLETQHAFKPPTAPGLRFSVKGKASEMGFLGWPSDFKEGEGAWRAGLFSTEAQAQETVHWRVPPPGGTCIPETLGDMERNGAAGELYWKPEGGVENYVFDALCALSFVAWLWPTLLREQLAVQPAFPDFIGPTLVVAAGRASFAPNALGGLLEACRAVPLEHFVPDGTCSTADELAWWPRRAATDGKKKPAMGPPREGHPIEFDRATQLPPIDTGQVGAAAAAAGGLRSCAGTRLRERARGGEGAQGKRRREEGSLDMDANADGRTSAASGSHKGAKRARKEVEKPQPQPQPLSAAEARGDGPQPLTADEARAAAAAEGLELEPSSTSGGFKGVTISGSKYSAQIRENSKKRHLGTFVTPEEAALCYARHVRARRAARGEWWPRCAGEHRLRTNMHTRSTR